MLFFHSTTEKAAQAIPTEGFRDARGSYGFMFTEFEGVFVSDVPVDVNEGAKGNILLSIELDVAESDLLELEVPRDENKLRHEWCVPAELLNTGRIALVVDSEDIELGPFIKATDDWFAKHGD